MEPGGALAQGGGALFDGCVSQILILSVTVNALLSGVAVLGVQRASFSRWRERHAVPGIHRVALPTHSAAERRLKRAVSPTTIDAEVDYCSRVAVRVPQVWASTLPAVSTSSAVLELVNAVPAALSRIVAETLSNVPSGVPSGAPNGV